mgnify:CR=1 FL=1
MAIRIALLKCCALCGPDADIEGKSTSKFLDFSKLNVDEYVIEGLFIGIKWFLSILEGRNNKKEIELMKRLKMTLEELEKSVKDSSIQN